MAAADELQWRRRFPFRALRRLGWVLVTGTIVTVIAWILFGVEPERLPSGDVNPLAAVPAITVLLVAALALPSLVSLLRRPILTANHYALTVRPGAVRTLVIPWSAIAELASIPVRGDPLLLVRCTDHRGQIGDRPGWRDRSALRAAVRAAGARRAEIGGYDLAVPLGEFAGDPATRLASLAAWAPRHVFLTDEL